MLDPTPYRELFPVTQQVTYLNHAGSSPLNTRTLDVLNRFNHRSAHENPMALFPEILQTIQELRQRAAALINAAGPDEIAMITNTAVGLNTVALSLPLRPGDNVLVLEGDYPANIYPWMNLAHRGVLTKMVPQRNGGLDLNLLAARIDHRTRAVALSTVMFATGFRNDMVALGKLCRERGLYFVVDGIQSLGVLPFDVQEAHVDFLSCGSYKWLMGPKGAGFLYVRRERIPELVPGAYVGATSVVDALNFLDYNFTLVESAQRFETGMHNISGIIGLNSTIGLLMEAGIEQIAERVMMLTQLAIDDLRERGYRIAASTDDAHRSGIVIVEVEQAEAACKRLNEAGVVVIPRGNGIRIAPHFYNTAEEVLRVGELLGAR